MSSVSKVFLWLSKPLAWLLTQPHNPGTKPFLWHWHSYAYTLHPYTLHPTQYIIISQGQRHLKTHAVNTKNDVCVYSMCFQRFSMQQNSGSQQCRQMQAMEASEQAAAKKEIANTITLPIRARSLQSVKMHQLHFWARPFTHKAGPCSHSKN